MKDEIATFVRTELLRDEGGDLASDTDLLASAGLDSLGMIRLISFLEERYGVKVEGHEVVPANFRTVDAIAAFVQGKR